MEKKSYLLLGIGGMGMAPLAIYLSEEGHHVYGWDDDLLEKVRQQLERAKVILLAFPEIPQNIDEVVFSSAIHEDHPLYQKALEQKLTLTRRGIFWSRAIEQKKLIAIVGSNGKTTTTGTLIHVLKEHHFPCSYLLGGLFCDPQVPPAHFDAHSDWIVSEIDESDRTIDYFSPEITIALNVGSDHVSNYGSVEAIQDSFRELFRRTRQCIFLPRENFTLLSLAEQSGTAYVPCDVTHLPYSQAFQEIFSGFQRIDYDLIAEVFHHLTGTFPSFDTFCNFPGIFQRNNLLASTEDHLFFCDHAHHPNEIQASLENFHGRYPTHGLCVIFRPHRFSRVQQYASEFAKALHRAERILLVPTDPSDEIPIPEGKCECIAQHIPQNISCEIVSDISEIPDIVEHWMAHTQRSLCCIYFTVGPSTFLGSLPEIQAKVFLKALRNQPELKTITIREHEPMVCRTSFKVGGPARLWAEPESKEQLEEILKHSQMCGLPVIFLGNGSNILCDNRGIPGLVISLRHAAFKDFQIKEGKQVRVGAGMSLRTLCYRLNSHALGGIEALSSIPGTVGGALTMNASAHGISLSDYLLSMEIIDREGHKKWILKEEVEWRYRRGFRHHKAWILSAIFEFPSVDPEESQKLQREYSQQRLQKQPLQPNAGSIFRNPESSSLKAWELIDRCGLRGFRIGDAEVSHQHVNFIVNKGCASSEDILRLIDHIRHKVFERFQIFLDREVLRIPSDLA
ncbi:MAG: UDP-N-acetylmuramate dehydrogenase [Puniceicoccales bacterium]|nr:UDP-N-acetylmuramate dehydrogenase [Puniceicoccales bacterium]